MENVVWNGRHIMLLESFQTYLQLVSPISATMHLEGKQTMHHQGKMNSNNSFQLPTTQHVSAQEMGQSIFYAKLQRQWIRTNIRLGLARHCPTIRPKFNRTSMLCSALELQLFRCIKLISAEFSFQLLYVKRAFWNFSLAEKLQLKFGTHLVSQPNLWLQSNVTTLDSAHL